MKRSLLLSMALVFSLITLHAQTVIWSEDFSDGLRGWSTRTAQCGNNFGNVIGIYEITSITVNGAEVTGVTGEFNIMNSLEYNVNFDDGTNYGSVYARYTLANDVMDSNLDAAGVPISGSSSTVDNSGYTTTSTVMEVSQTAFDDWASVLSGLADPGATLDGAVLTLTSGNTVVTLTNKGVCGGLFYYSSDGAYGTPFTAPTVMGSETAANGVVFFNAVMQTWKEDNDNLNVPPSEYPEYTTSLITPDIDISTATRALALEFTQAILYLNISEGAPAVPVTETFSRQVRTAFEVSTDGGVNWSAPIQINEEVPANSWRETAESIPIPATAIGDASSIRLRFTFGSDFYFWGLDDIQIVEREAYDMQINENFYAVYTNYATPVSQADSAAFLADIQNNGGLDATNVQLNLVINANSDGAEIYNDTKDYGTITVDSIAENQLFDEVLDPANLAVGVYTGTYAILHDEADNNTTNDSIFFEFVMTDTTFAKEDGRGVRGISPADDVSYTYGNVFYVPNGNGFVARNISFGVSNGDELAGRSVNTYIYKWGGDENADGLANSSEYGSPLALNSYTFVGTEPDTTLISIPFDFEGGEVPLEDNSFYIVALQYINSADDQTCNFLVSENIDYGASEFANALAGLERPPVVLNVGPEPSPDLALASFVGNPVPVVRMSIAQTVNTPNILSEENKIKVYPNPTNRDVNLEVALVNTSNKIQISVIDAAGRTIQNNLYSNFKEGKFNYDLSNLSSGFYFIRILTDDGLRTEKIFLQR
ncbi:MAG: T9SS type A sorting domain-containing protein [Saprospiraceae bacterium]|nr:T9SS type A sorting domain-containing protein [Saprospiraceae bacterium]